MSSSMPTTVAGASPLSAKGLSFTGISRAELSNPAVADSSGRFTVSAGCCSSTSGGLALLTALCKSIAGTEEVIFSVVGATDGKTTVNLSEMGAGEDAMDRLSPRASLAASWIMSSITGNKALGCREAIVINECAAAGSVDSQSMTSAGSSRAAIIAL
ncbi:hypothetical protein D3C81_526290 [compost metagenome]